jgi:hypothetical protein
MMSIEALLDHLLERKELPYTEIRPWRWSDQVLEELAAQPLRASIYRDRMRNRALIVVTNFARVPVRGKVTLKPDGIGVPSASWESLAVTDVDDWPTLDGDTRSAPGQAVPIHDGAIELAVDGHDFRLVEVTWR